MHEYLRRNVSAGVTTNVQVIALVRDMNRFLKTNSVAKDKAGIALPEQFNLCASNFSSTPPAKC
jgi:hypothetical protein